MSTELGIDSWSQVCQQPLRYNLWQIFSLPNGCFFSFIFMKPTGVKNNRKTAVHSHRQSHDIDRVQVTLFTGITVLYSLSFSYNMHRKEWKFGLIKARMYTSIKETCLKSCPKQRNSSINSHFYEFLPQTGRRAPRQQCARGERGNTTSVRLWRIFTTERAGERRGGGADGSSDHTTGRHFLGLLPPLPLTQSSKIDDRPTVRESNLPKFSTEQQPYNFFIDDRWYYDRILVL
jgi:hypothetical protein